MDFPRNRGHSEAVVRGGFNPVITYDNKATKGNKWNVPLGLVVTKTTAIAKQPVKFQFGIEYSESSARMTSVDVS